MMLHGHPGGFHQCPTQFLAPLFGDRPGVMRLTAVMDAATQARIPNQFLRSGETGDVTNGRKDSHSIDQAKTGQLQQVSAMLTPGKCGA